MAGRRAPSPTQRLDIGPGKMAKSEHPNEEGSGESHEDIMK